MLRRIAGDAVGADFSNLERLTILEERVDGYFARRQVFRCDVRLQ